MEKSRYARFLFLCMHNRTFYYVHVNNDPYMEQMNHSVVIKLKINNFMYNLQVFRYVSLRNRKY